VRAAACVHRILTRVRDDARSAPLAGSGCLHFLLILGNGQLRQIGTTGNFRMARLRAPPVVQL
jgi:hypothetical protein